MDRVVALIEREARRTPSAHLCVIEPGISVGMPGRVSIDMRRSALRPASTPSEGLDVFNSTHDRDREDVLGKHRRERLALT